MKKLLFICLFLTGCSAAYRQAKDVKQMGTLALQYPASFATLAAKLVPCFSGVAKSDTIIQKSKPDTVQLSGTTVITHVKDTLVKTVTLPGRIITNTVTKTIRDTVIDNRVQTAVTEQLKVSQDSLLLTKQTLTTASKTASKFKLWLWLLVGIELAAIVGMVAWKIYGIANGSGIKNLFK